MADQKTQAAAPPRGLQVPELYRPELKEHTQEQQQKPEPERQYKAE